MKKSFLLCILSFTFVATSAEKIRGESQPGRNLGSLNAKFPRRRHVPDPNNLSSPPPLPPPETPPSPSPPPPSPPSPPAAGEFTYCYDTRDTSCGPLVWEQIPIENNECGGRRNSPIAIASTNLGLNSECQQLDYIFDRGTCTYGQMKYEILVDTIKASYPTEGCVKPTVKIGNLTYEGLQYHLHDNSEHSIEGRFFAAELHIVHQLLEGGPDAEPFAVIGYTIESGSELGFFDPTIDSTVPGWIEAATKVSEDCGLPCPPRYFYTGTRHPDYFVDPYSILPGGPKFYQYAGGLTTPPCTEGVFWNLLVEPVQLGVAQVDTLTRLILDYIDPETCEYATNADPISGSTSRPPQDPLDRPINVVGFCR